MRIFVRWNWTGRWAPKVVTLTVAMDDRPDKVIGQRVEFGPVRFGWANY